MQRPVRAVDVSAKIAALRDRHADLETRLRAFEKRIYLTPSEEMAVKELKLRKLRTKEELHRFEALAHA